MARLGRSYPIRPLVRQYNMAIDGQSVWFAVYITATGELYSVGNDLSAGLDPSMSFVELARYPIGVVWDPATLTFIPRYDPLIDRIADLQADPALATVWASLSGPETTALIDRLITFLGPFRYYDSSHGMDL